MAPQTALAGRPAFLIGPILRPFLTRFVVLLWIGGGAMTLPSSPAMSPLPEGLSFSSRPVLTRVLQSLSCPVIVERLPELLKFSKEEKWQLVVELQDELLADDPTEEEPLKSDIVAALDRSMRHYCEHPESAVTLDQLTEKMGRLKK